MRVRAKKCEEDGIKFDSGAERDRYRELKLLMRVGEIRRLQCHPTFRIVVNEIEICKYKPDFVYERKAAPLWAASEQVVEDVKGWKKSKKTGRMLPRVNREFGIKRKLMSACFGLTVTLV